MKDDEQRQQQSSENLAISRRETQASKSARVSTEPIPVDLLIEIFSRVPSKSIARFRCVSKYWGSIFRRPDFIELLLARCPRILFTLEVNKELIFFSSPQLSNPEENSCVVATRYNTSVPKYVPRTYMTMRCGLVLCQGYSSGRYERRKVRVICNPATGEFLTLPKLLLKDKTLANVKPEIELVCFGYDPINKQIKVLCMTSSNTHRVLTLENGKRKWRKIKSHFNYMGCILSPAEICINGVLYFGCGLKSSYGIVCFDIRSEKLSLIKIDKGMVGKGPFTLGTTTLINFKGKFGIHKRRSNGFVLWVLENAGNHKWSKYVHVFSPRWKKIVHKKGLYITGMTSTGEMVFAPKGLSKANPFYVFYYNYERKTFTRVTMRGFEELSHNRPGIKTFLDYGENMRLFK